MKDSIVTASSIIDRAISLKDGGVIVIPCNSYEDMERLRIRLYKVRNQLSKNYESIAKTLDITRKTKEGKHTLYVSKEVGLPGVFIIEEGEALPFAVTEDFQESQEEVKEVKQEQDFDSVAAEIEASQGLIEEEK